MQYILGLDIGTTHCKAVAVTAQGELLHQATAGYPTIQSLPGQSEQDAELIYGSVLEVLQYSLVSLRQHELKAVCFSAAMHSIMAVDDAGHPLTNLFTWADTRGNEYALTIRNWNGSHDLYARTGTPVHPMSPLCKLAWMKKVMPDIVAKAAKFISIKEYVFFKLTGTYIVDYSIASATGLFDIQQKKWDATALGLAGINAGQLSEPVPVSYAETNLQQACRQLLGITGDIPFIVGGSDGCLANIGSGAILPGEAALTIGTSGAIRVTVEKSRTDQQQRLFNYILTDNLFVTGGAISNGGAAMKWFAENFLQHPFTAATDIDWMVQLAHEAPEGAGGLIFLPYLSGERAPFWDASARAVFMGLQTAHGRQHLARAVVEGISFALYQVMQAVEANNGNISVVYASGAFITSPLWLQMMADVMDKTIIVAGTADASAMGAAFLGMHTIGWIKNLSEIKQLVTQEASFSPDAAKHRTYQRYFDVYQDLYPKLKDNFRQLEKLQQP
ncbi:MAG TPA: gluconokinase [Chitinophagaceae bacterium]|nr:gluconokinase [Chitinophagaceae bacterium]